MRRLSRVRRGVVDAVPQRHRETGLRRIFEGLQGALFVEFDARRWVLERAAQRVQSPRGVRVVPFASAPLTRLGSRIMVPTGRAGPSSKSIRTHGAAMSYQPQTIPVTAARLDAVVAAKFSSTTPFPTNPPLLRRAVATSGGAFRTTASSAGPFGPLSLTFPVVGAAPVTFQSAGAGRSHRDKGRARVSRCRTAGALAPIASCLWAPVARQFFAGWSVAPAGRGRPWLTRELLAPPSRFHGAARGAHQSSERGHSRLVQR